MTSSFHWFFQKNFLCYIFVHKINVGIIYQMDPELFTFLTRVHYHDPGDGVWGEHEIDHILFFQGDVKVKPNCDEISEYSFVPKNEFNAWVIYLFLFFLL